MPNQLKKDIDLYISETRVFNETDEEKVFEKIKMLEKRKTRRIQHLFPQAMSFVGIAFLMFIIAGVIVLNSGKGDSNKMAEKPAEKPTAVNQADQPQSREAANNSFDINQIKPGAKVGNWTLTGLEKSPGQFKQRSFSAQFSGDMILTGTLICLDREEYGLKKGEVVFFPDDKLSIPRALQEDGQNPLLVIVNDELYTAQEMGLQVGEKRDSVNLRIQKVINFIDEGSKEKLDKLIPYNGSDTRISINQENAPDTLIMDWKSYVKSSHPNYLDEFAKHIGGAVYGVDNTDIALVIKDNRIVLTNSIGNYSVSYEYMNEFKKFILSKYEPQFDNLVKEFDKFLQTGNPIKVDVNSNSFSVYDESGKAVIQMPI